MSFFDYRDAVFDYVANKVNEYRADINVGSVAEPEPASFPVCFIYEIGSTRLERYVTTGYTDQQCESTFEIQVASNALSGAAKEANAILDEADAAMNDCGFIRYSRARIDNGDRRVFRVFARYRRIIGGGDSIPAFTRQGENENENSQGGIENGGT